MFVMYKVATHCQVERPLLQSSATHCHAGRPLSQSSVTTCLDGKPLPQSSATHCTTGRPLSQCSATDGTAGISNNEIPHFVRNDKKYSYNGEEKVISLNLHANKLILSTLSLIPMPKIKAIMVAALMLAVTLTHSQSPNAIPYQGVARNAAGDVLGTQNIGLRISLRDVTAGGTIVYQETHTTTTTALGLFNVNIGTGTPLVGTLAAVNWGNGAKFVQVEMDPAGGTAYIDMGTTQLMSVPYALYAGKSHGGVNYAGTWNANFNTPPLVSSTGTQGDYFVVNNAGTTLLDGINEWKVGDWAIFNGNVWEKVDNTDHISDGTALGNTMRWNGTAWVSDNTIYNDGTNIGLGTVIPQSKLHVASNLFPPVQLQLNDNVTTFFANPTAIITNGSQTTGNWSFIGFADTATANPFLSAKIGAKFTDRTNNYASLGFGTRSATGMAERMTISSDGNVGIGTVSPASNYKLHVVQPTLGNFAATFEGVFPNTEATIAIRLNGNNAYVSHGGWGMGPNFLGFGGDDHAYPDMVINTPTGNVGIGTTLPNYRLSVRNDITGSNFVAAINNLSNINSAFNHGMFIRAGHSTFSSLQSSFIIFYTPAGVNIGSINQTSGSSVAYNTTSDERLKTNITPTKYGLKQLKQIEVKDYYYKNDDKTAQNGFIAQQLYKIYPFAVSPGGDDAKTQPWMMDYGKMTPLLVKSIQEQQTQIEAQQKLIDTLTKRLEALENK